MDDFIALIHAIIEYAIIDCRHHREAWDLLDDHDELLPFLGKAICWGQCRPDLVKGFQRLNGTVPHEAILRAVRSICFFLSQEYQAYELLKTIGTVAIAKDSELPAIVGMIRLCGNIGRRYAGTLSFYLHPCDELKDIIFSLMSGGCVDEFVMKELAGLRDFYPKFVARCTARILCEHPNVLSDSRFAGALRSGLIATTLSICAELGRKGIRILAPLRGVLGDDGDDADDDDDDSDKYYDDEEEEHFLEDEVGAEQLGSEIVHRLYRIRLHHKTHKILGSMTPLEYRGLEAKLEHIFRDAQDSLCPNCLGTFDRKALKWCKGTGMLEPFCSRKCFEVSWHAEACADFRDVVKKDDDKRLISLKRNVLQAGSKVFEDNVGRIVREYNRGMALGQGLTMAVDLREFPPRVRSGLFPVDPSDCVQVTFIAEDFRGFRDGLEGKVLKLRKRFPMKRHVRIQATVSELSELYRRLPSKFKGWARL